MKSVKRKYTPEKYPVVVIDLDNTIWTEDFPNFGEPFHNAIETINKMNDIGYEVIIFTARGGDNLKECIYHLQNDLGLDKSIKFNEHSEYMLERYPVQSGKVNGHIFLDDKGYNAPDYSKHWNILYKEFIGD